MPDAWLILSKFCYNCVNSEIVYGPVKAHKVMLNMTVEENLQCKYCRAFAIRVDVTVCEPPLDVVESHFPALLVEG